MPPTRRQNDNRIPTMPTGVEVASYSTYLEAQQAVDHLSDQAFDVRAVTIVGTDLRLVERITGRLTYARVAGAGAMSGAWFGLMIALVFWVISPDATFPILAGVLIGMAFGILFAIVSYALTGGKRDFTSASQVVAARYSILSTTEHAGEVRRLLTTAGKGGRRAPASDGAPAGTGGPGVPTGGAGPGAPTTGPSHPGHDPRSAVAAPPAEPSAPPRDPYAPPADPYAPPSDHGRHAAPGGQGAPVAPGSPNAPLPGRSAPLPGQAGPAQGGTGSSSSGAGPDSRNGNEPGAEERRRERPRYGLRLEDLDQPSGKD